MVASILGNAKLALAYKRTCHSPEICHRLKILGNRALGRLCLSPAHGKIINTHIDGVGLA